MSDALCELTVSRLRGGRVGTRHISCRKEHRTNAWLVLISFVLHITWLVIHMQVQAAQLLLGVDLGGGGPVVEPAHKRHKTLAPQSGPNSKSDDIPTHSILELGWRPLCRVRCNRLEGELLGGHDREVFVRCVSAPYVRLSDTALEQVRCLHLCYL